MENSPSSSTTPKKERRVIEKNRRIHMKILYSNLCSLIPDHTSKEALPLPDQIDVAINYIKSLETKIEESKEKKENLMGRSKRSSKCNTNETNMSLKSPKMEIYDMGDSLQVVFITGLQNQSTFHQIIRLIHQEGAEVVNASFSAIGNSVIHIQYAKIGQSARISERLNMLVHGVGSEEDEEESMLKLWDFEIQSDLWDFDNFHASSASYGN